MRSRFWGVTSLVNTSVCRNKFLFTPTHLFWYSCLPLLQVQANTFPKQIEWCHVFHNKLKNSNLPDSFPRIIVKNCFWSSGFQSRLEFYHMNFSTFFWGSTHVLLFSLIKKPFSHHFYPFTPPSQIFWHHRNYNLRLSGKFWYLLPN